jgi:hypothetical protein
LGPLAQVRAYFPIPFLCTAVGQRITFLFVTKGKGDRAAKVDELKRSVRESGSWTEEHLASLSEAEIDAVVRHHIGLILDLLEGHSVEEVSKETGIHREGIVVAESLRDSFGGDTSGRTPPAPR